jgi:ADP-ribose pyrophosphatase YjhB (NUDIX family)
MSENIMIAKDFEEVQRDSGAWSISWHPPGNVPVGKKHGSAGVCVTEQDSPKIILVRIRDTAYWEFPGGRPKRGETWLETLAREVQEEACARVIDARLLGYVRTRQVSGDVVVRAVWKAKVDLLEWDPVYEIAERGLFSRSEALGLMGKAYMPVALRALSEAGIGAWPRAAEGRRP